MQRLYVLYDAHCPLCLRCRVWLAQQRAFVPLVFMPLDSAEAGCRFPSLADLQPDRELVVISDTGEVWQGAAAWVMCLWALQDFREWAQRFAHPALLPLARRACEFVSHYRYQLSDWLFHPETSVETLRDGLAGLPVGGGRSEGYSRAR